MPPAITQPALSPESAKVMDLPPVPSNPPTKKDVANGLKYAQHMLNAHVRKEVKDEELVDAELYKNKLLSSQAGSDPVWMEGAISQLRNALGNLLDEKLAPIKAELVNVKADLQDLKLGQAHAQRLAAITHNRSSGTGADALLEVVPFTDGRYPTKPPLNLPPLTCRKKLEDLSSRDRDQYYKGYYPTGRLPSVNERVSKILQAIGADKY